MLLSTLSLIAAAGTGGSSFFGTVQAPPGVREYDAAPGAGDLGVVLFLSNMLRLMTIGAGLFVLINIIIAGFDYISSQGDKSAHQKVRDKITFSIVGLAIMVGAYAIAALVGLLIFGDAGFIISPTICGPGEC